MTDYIVIALLIILIVLAVVNLVRMKDIGKDTDEDDGKDDEAVLRLMGKLEENKDAVKYVSGQFDTMSKTQYAQNRARRSGPEA